MNEQDLISHFVLLIEDCGYEVVYTDMGMPAVLSNDRRLVLLSQTEATIFSVAHEYAHIKLGHTGRLMSFNGNDERNSNEYRANELAVSIIVRNHIDMGCVYNSTDIMEWYGIPSFLESLVVDIMKELFLYAEYVYN